MDNSLRLSACSFLTFLADINNFGYNPTARGFQEHLHYLRLMDAEVLKEVNSRLQSSKDTVELAYLRLVKEEVYEQVGEANLVRAPFLQAARRLEPRLLRPRRLQAAVGRLRMARERLLQDERQVRLQAQEHEAARRHHPGLFLRSVQPPMRQSLSLPLPRPTRLSPPVLEHTSKERHRRLHH